MYELNSNKIEYKIDFMEILVNGTYSRNWKVIVWLITEKELLKKVLWKEITCEVSLKYVEKDEKLWRDTAKSLRKAQGSHKAFSCSYTTKNVYVLSLVLSFFRFWEPVLCVVSQCEKAIRNKKISSMEHCEKLLE